MYSTESEFMKKAINSDVIFFSILICCYNSEKYIEETINSIIDQSYGNWEIIIIDDGSIDKTKKIIQKYIKKNINIKYFFQKNSGFASARNLGLINSTYEWIVIIDHDDIALPDRLEIHKSQIENNSNAKLFFGDTIHFKEGNDLIRKNLEIFNLNKINLKKKEIYNSLLLEGCFIDSESVVLNKKTAIEIGGFNNRYKYLADYDFFCRLGLFYEFGMTNKTLSKWRVHEEQASKTMESIYKKELLFFYIYNFFRKNSLYIKIILIKRVIKGIIKSLL